MAGELIRILVNHPDVKLSYVCQAGLEGCDIKSVHHGLIGERALEFCEAPDFSKCDLVFIAGPEDQGDVSVPSVNEAPDLCVVDMISYFPEARESDAFVVYGVPELNRKPLVRGARRAVIPPAEEVLTSIALLPLGLRSLLPAALDLNIAAKTELRSKRTDFNNVSDAMSLAGNEPRPMFSIKYSDNASERVMRLSTALTLPLPLDNIVEMYEALYDDHNLTYIVGESVPDKEVAGTDKCIVSLDKTPEGMLSVEAVADARLRGGAGDAVHVMNLLMGLYEKTGLTLRASTF